MESGKGDKEMDSRVGNLERSVAVLQTTQDGMKITLDKVASGLDKLLQQQPAKPFSLRDSLSTILTTLSIFSICILALGYMIDTRATAKAEPAVRVAEMLMHDGDYYILKERVSRLEKALSWTPIVMTAEAARRAQ